MDALPLERFRDLIQASRYERLIESLRQASEQCASDHSRLRDGLIAYQELRDLKSTASSLLLLRGNPIRLPRDPAAVYLLPPVPSHRARWILLQYGRDGGNHPAIQFVTWDPSNPDNPLSDRTGLYQIEDQDTDLSQLARDVKTHAIEDQVLVYLTTKYGRLEVKSDADEPKIYGATWNPDKILRTRWERAGSGDTPHILAKTRPYGSSDWRDDQLEDPEGNGIDLPRDLKPGHIHAVDCRPDAHHILYIGNNRAHVYRIDLKGETDFRSSPRLGGVIRDILVQPHPDIPGDVAIFAVCNNGIVYMLDENAPEGRLRVAYRQYMDRHVRHLLGVDGDLVALDQSQNLIPLCLGKQKSEASLLAEFNSRALECTSLLADSHPLWERAASLDPEERQRFATLALDAFLLQLSDAEQPGPDPVYFAVFCSGWLSNAYAVQDDGIGPAESWPEAMERASLHEALLRRLWRWLEEARDVQPEAPGAGLSVDRLEQFLPGLWSLLSPPEDAPDHLWSSLFVGADALQPWIGRFGGEAHILLERQYATWRRVIPRMRSRLHQGLAEIRPLGVQSTTRLTSQPRHIRVVDKHRRLITFVEYGEALRLVRVPGGTSDDWVFLSSIRQDHDWTGLPRALASGPRLAELLAPTRPAAHVFLATDRGELRLYRVEGDDAQLRNVASERIEMDVRCCTIVRDGPFSGLLLGGSNGSGQACIHWLRFQGSADSIEISDFPIWKDKTRGGSLRMLGLVGAGRNRYLWATDRQRGILYRWRFAPSPNRRGAPLLQEAQQVLRDRKDLHTLARDREGRTRLVLTGGRDGLTLALDKDDLALHWAAGSGRRLNRAFFLPSTHQWLLCSDHKNAILVDEDGTISGSLLQVGPISAGRLLDDQTLVLGNQSGRLLLLSTGKPASSNGVRDIPDGISPVQEHTCYPMRTARPLPKSDLLPVLEELAEYESVMRDPFCAVALLSHAWKRIEASGLSKPVATALRPMLQRLPTVMLASFLTIRRLRIFRRRSPEARSQVSELMDWLWREMRYRDDTDNQWHQTRAILEVFEQDFVDKLTQEVNDTLSSRLPAIRMTHEEPRAAWDYLTEYERRLFRDILHCIWNGKHCATGAPDNYLSSGLQLGQAARMWSAAQHMTSSSRVCDRINRWLDLLWRLWGVAEPVVFRAKLKRLLDQGVPLLPQPWYAWLVALLAEPVAGRDGTTSAPTPPPLNLLENLPQTPWNPTLLAPLYEIQQQDPAWRRWLDDIQGRLQTLASARSGKTRVAWQERAELDALLDHVAAETEKPFSLASGHGLLVLWIPRLEQRWERVIRPQLELLAALDPAQYFDVRVTEDEQWASDKKVELFLTLHNRHQNGILVQSVQWQGERVSMIPGSVMIRADEEGLNPGERLSVSLVTTKSNRLRGTLRCYCADTVRNAYFTIEVPCEKLRDLSKFFQGERWSATGHRLEELLTEDTPFVWVDGNHWEPDSRAFLKDLIKTQFARVVGDDIPVMRTFADALDSPETLFCPDIPIQAGSEDALADWFHRALHNPKKPAFKPLALAIWHRARPLPPTIAAALGTLLPSNAQVDDFLLRLLGGTRQAQLLMDGIMALPERALGAWCYGDPIYAELLREHKGQFDAQELYEEPAGLLNMTTWRRLAKLPETEIADWLHIEPSRLGHRLVSELFRISRGEESTLDHAVKSLLHKLGNGRITRIEGAPVWRLDCTLVLLEQEYEACHLLVGTLPPTPIQDLIGDAPPSLWLSTRKPPQELPRPALGLSRDDCLRLMHTDRAETAHSILNQRLAIQEVVDPGRIFRVANGLGDERRIARHFFGRFQERRTLRRLLEESDRPDVPAGVAVLVVGGRRMGKTSLREWLDYRVRAESVKQQQRLHIVIDWQALPQGLKSPDLVHWFYHAVLPTLAQRGYPLDQPWEHPRSEQESKDALHKFWVHLQDIKKKTGKTPLLLFDETHSLVHCDHPDFPLFTQLRHWVTNSLLCLVATTYPHGQGHEKSLNILVNESKGPLYNLFSDVLRLRPWSPDEAWTFLRTRLGYLGVTIPASLRDQVLQITQGIPWIVHQLGLELFGEKTNGRRLVTDADWRRAQRETLNAIEAELTETVRAAAERDDKEQPKSHGRDLPDRQRLGEGRLWNATRLADVAVSRLAPTGSPQRAPLRPDTRRRHEAKAVARARHRDVLERRRKTVAPGRGPRAGHWRYGVVYTDPQTRRPGRSGDPDCGGRYADPCFDPQTHLGQHLRIGKPGLAGGTAAPLPFLAPPLRYRADPDCGRIGPARRHHCPKYRRWTGATGNL